MRKVLMIVLVLVVLVGGGIYFKNQSSYTEHEGMQDEKIISEGITAGDENAEDENTEGVEKEAENTEDVEVGVERTTEDIALDKRLDEERKKNEKTYREEGITGTSFRPTIEIPNFSLDEYSDIFKTVETYMRENSDRFSEPSDDGTTRKTPDPRIENSLYAEEKSGIIKGFEDENLVAFEVKKLDGEYTIIVLGRESKGEEWRVLSEGDVYQLRKELTDGD